MNNHLKGQVTYREYLESINLQIRSAQSMRWPLRISLYTFALIGLCYGFSDQAGIGGRITGSVIVFIVLLKPVFRCIFIPAVTWRIYSKSRSMGASIDVQINAEGITYNSKKDRQTHIWSDYTEKDEGKRVITLHHKDGRWIIFPKRLFSDESELAFFRECTDKKISPTPHEPSHNNSSKGKKWCPGEGSNLRPQD
ncbi:MAG: YcxB family protein [Pontiellaceae bacterium]|nr:YcxB family protein [Pontiellaceae bacterium]